MKWTGQLSPRALLWAILPVLVATQWAAGDVSAQQGGQETVYRITIVKGLDEQRARDYKLQLESLGFLPINLDFRNQIVSVLYGNFPTHADALRAKERLETEGFDPREIVEIVRGGAIRRAAQQAGIEPVYRVLVQEFADSGEADSLKQILEEAGHFGVEAKSAGGSVQVIVGSYPDRNNAQNLLVLLREQGYVTARVIEMLGGVESGASRAARATTPVTQARPIVRQSRPSISSVSQILSPVVMQSDIWKSLSEDQKRRVMDTVIMQERIRSGDELVGKIIDIEKRLGNLETSERKLVEQITDEREVRARKTTNVGRLYRDAQNLGSSGRFEDAIILLKEILRLDKDNQSATTLTRIFENRLNGEMYEGQNAETDEKHALLLAEAEAEGRKNTIASLELAKGIWLDIKLLDAKFEQEATNKINELGNRIGQLRAENAAFADEEERKAELIRYGLIGAIGVLAVVVALLFVRSYRSHRQLMRTIHEITSGSIRPMRDLEMAGAGAGQLSGGGAAGLAAPTKGTDDIFSAGGGDSPPGDPLAGVSTEAPVATPGEETEDIPAFSGGAPPGDAVPDILGDSDSQGGAADTESSPFDTGDIFGEVEDTGGMTDEPPLAAVATPPEAAEQTGADASAFDDIFGDIGSGGGDQTDPSATDPSSSDPLGGVADESKSLTAGFEMEDIFSEAKEEPAAPPPPPPADEEVTSISFGDVMPDDSAVDQLPAEAPPVEAPAATGDDPLAILNGPPATEAPPETAPATGGTDPFSDTPFASVFGDDAAGGGTESSTGPKDSAITDDTEIPAIKLDIPDDDPFASLKLGGDDSDTSTKKGPSSTSAETAESAPPISAPPLSMGTAAPSATAAAEGAQLLLHNFEQDEIGSFPSGWSGQCDYSNLTVEDTEPPPGTKRYIVYRKGDGAGKVYYSTKFPNTSGILSVEFDLRCNDKNKFLLGFYIEKDEDFQQSVHTKILRSEAQTAPTIHIHGEPAPYLLGSWAHIKYVINLKEGKVDGYIDSTHIARELRLPQVPKFLNTLAIRDNVNTTGELLIANIRVMKID